MAKNKKITLSLDRVYESMLNELVEERKRKAEFPDLVTEESILKHLIFNEYFSTTGGDDDPDDWIKRFHERFYER